MPTSADYLLTQLAEERAKSERLRSKASKLRRSRDQWRERAYGKLRTFPADDPRHGTENGYSNLDCRCAKCRESHRNYMREYTHRTGRRRPIAELRAEWAALPIRHGTESGYCNRKCRCDRCTEAARVARASRRNAAQKREAAR